MSTDSPIFQHSLPQNGWVLSSELAKAVDLSDETVRDWVARFSLPATFLGSRCFIQMERFFEALQRLGETQARERRGIDLQNEVRPVEGRDHGPKPRRKPAKGNS